MNYSELLHRALKGQTVNAAAKSIGIPQASLDRYVKGQRMPGPQVMILLADAANVDIATAVQACAEKEAEAHPKASFVKKFLTCAVTATLLSGCLPLGNYEDFETSSSYNDLTFYKLCEMLNAIRKRLFRRATDANALAWH